jgi:uncharacterized protein (DUF342 family)
MNKTKMLKSGKLRNLTTQQLKKEVVKLKHQCIFCNSDQGMVFTYVKSDIFRELSYSCNKPQPCTTKKVKFLLGKQLDAVLLSDRAEYNDDIDTMLKTKYDLSFDYVANIDLKTLTENYKVSKEMLEYYLVQIDGVKNNPKKRDELHQLETQLNGLLGAEPKTNEIVALENRIQRIKHPTLTVLEKEYTFDHMYTLNDLFFYNSIE